MDQVPKVIADYIAAYNSKDLDRMLACFSTDVHFVNISGDVISAEAKGEHDFRVLAEQGLRFFTERNQTISNCIGIGNHVSLRIKYRAVVASDLPNGWKAGQTIELEGMSLFTLANGSIAELTDIA